MSNLILVNIFLRTDALAQVEAAMVQVQASTRVVLTARMAADAAATSGKPGKARKTPATEDDDEEEV